MRRHAGFNLIELMVVITIAAIMLGIGVPSFRQFTATQRVKSAAFDFAAALLLARSEAVKRNVSVTLSQATGGWANGWTVTAGVDTVGNQQPTNQVAITPNPDTTTSIAYQSNGRVAGTMRFEFTAPNTTAVRCVTISTSGVPNTSTASCS
jgi:type IV fimbrial biogenesis protein FimT